MACSRFWRASTSGRAACWRACDDDGVGASSSNFSRHSVAATPHGRLVVVLDNLSIHTTPEIRAWLAAQQGRVRFEFLPLHASWLNQIEIWFSILERQALTRASDTAYRLRAARIQHFIRHWNRSARPFRWTFKALDRRPRTRHGARSVGLTAGSQAR